MRKELKELKKGLIIAWIVGILFFVPILCLTEEYKIAIVMALMVTILFGSILLAVIIGEKINLLSKKKEIKKQAKWYAREIPKTYTVSMASLLLDNVFDEIVDIPATILSLIGRNILIYENNNLSVQQIDESSNLYNHEEYVYECIKENKRIQPNKFRKYVIEDALGAKYIKKNETKDFWKKSILIFLILAILTFVCAICLTGLPEFLHYTIVLLLFFSAITAPIAISNKHDIDKNNPYKNTRLGNKEVRRLLGLKKYLKEFSMIDKRQIKEVILWEDYLAYAYMFGINKRIFEEFKELKQINNIIN